MSRDEMIHYLQGPYPYTNWKKYKRAQLVAIFLNTVKRLGGR